MPHNSLAVTGGCCLAVACLIPGTTANRLARGIPVIGVEECVTVVQMRNPAGVLRARIAASMTASQMHISSAAYERSAQIFLRGHFPLYGASAQLAAFGNQWQA
jgi:2-methylaconitate cis-trans-isomerase PrpF